MHTYHTRGEVLEVYAQGRLDRTTTRHDAVAFECPLDDAQRVVEGTLHLIEHVVVGTAEDDGRRVLGLGAFDEDALIVGDAFLNDLLGLTEVRRLKGLLTVQVGQGRDKGGYVTASVQRSSFSF